LTAPCPDAAIGQFSSLHKGVAMTDNKADLPKHDANLISSENLLRLIVIVLVLELGSLILGIAFFVMLHGLIFGIVWFIPYWEPAHRVYTSILHLPPNQFRRTPIPWWRAILLGIKAAIVLYCLYAGIWILITHGFLDQNFIHTLIQSSSR
jgi:hypothetical protein